jgi:RNA polymerase sigma-70 factor (ECF subfamily)
MEEEIRQIIAKCKEGDIGSFEQLVNQYSTRVSNIIYQTLGSPNDVDDLTQDVFIKVFRNIKYFREDSQFFTWLYRIAVNTVWDYLRKQKHRKTVPIENIAPLPFEAKKENKELKELLHAQIQELPENYRIVLILKDIEGMSYKEICDVLNCRIGTVESRLFRAREFLKEKLEKTSWWRDFL